MHELLHKLQSPLLEQSFFDSSTIDGAIPPDRVTVSRKTIVSIFQCKNFGSRPKFEELSSREIDELTLTLTTDHNKSRLSLMTSDLEKLRDLPLFETLEGSRVNLPVDNTTTRYTLDANEESDLLFLLPEANKSKFLKEKEDLKDLLKDCGVEKLTEPVFLMKFVLPDYSNLPINRKEKINALVKNNWDSSYKQSNEFKEILKTVPFVKGGIEGNVFKRPSELYDPRQTILR